MSNGQDMSIGPGMSNGGGAGQGLPNGQSMSVGQNLSISVQSMSNGQQQQVMVTGGMQQHGGGGMPTGGGVQNLSSNHRQALANSGGGGGMSLPHNSPHHSGLPSSSPGMPSHSSPGMPSPSPGMPNTSPHHSSGIPPPPHPNSSPQGGAGGMPNSSPHSSLANSLVVNSSTHNSLANSLVVNSSNSASMVNSLSVNSLSNNNANNSTAGANSLNNSSGGGGANSIGGNSENSGGQGILGGQKLTAIRNSLVSPSQPRRVSQLGTGRMVFKCEQCDKYLSTRQALLCHHRTHTGEKPFRCDECGKYFSQVGSLNRHKQMMHSGERPPKRIRAEPTFKQLIGGGAATTATGPDGAPVVVTPKPARTHTGEKPFRCDECGKYFSQVGSLKIHKRIHTGEKPYRCEVCEKAFTINFYLRTHMRVHTGEKPYECSFCNKRFSQSTSLRTHMKQHVKQQLAKVVNNPEIVPPQNLSLKSEPCDKEFRDQPQENNEEVEMQLQSRIQQNQATERLLYERSDGQNLFLPERSDGLTPGQMFFQQERSEGPRSLFIPTVQQHIYAHPYHKQEEVGLSFAPKPEVGYSMKQEVIFPSQSPKQDNMAYKQEAGNYHKEDQDHLV